MNSYWRDDGGRGRTYLGLRPRLSFGVAPAPRVRAGVSVRLGAVVLWTVFWCAAGGVAGLVFVLLLLVVLGGGVR